MRTQQDLIILPEPPNRIELLSYVYPSKNRACLVSRDRDSNPGPAVYKTAALPLSHLGKPILRDPVNLSQFYQN